MKGAKVFVCAYHYHGDLIILENIIRKANLEYMNKHAWRKNICMGGKVILNENG